MVQKKKQKSSVKKVGPKKVQQKGEQTMTKGQKIALTLLIIGTLGFIKFAFFSDLKPKEPTPEVTTEETAPKPEEQQESTTLSYVNIYFIGQNSNKEEVYKIVKREYDPQQDGTKLRRALLALLKGPSAKERTKGIYSEIPSGTKLLSLDEAPDKITINLSGDFQQGGGTDSVYKRVFQLIKTANKNTTVDVYLNIDGKPAEVLGGEGIMINQPLNNKSLDE